MKLIKLSILYACIFSSFLGAVKRQDESLIILSKNDEKENFKWILAIKTAINSIFILKQISLNFQHDHYLNQTITSSQDGEIFIEDFLTSENLIYLLPLVKQEFNHIIDLQQLSFSED